MGLARGLLILAILGCTTAWTFKEGDNFENDTDYILQEENMEIVGYGDECDEKGSICDKKIGLVCSQMGICECDTKRGLTYYKESKKCVDANFDSDEDTSDSKESKEKDKQSDSSEEKTSKISKSSAESADKDQSAPIPKIKFGAPVKRTQTNDDASESQQSNGKSSVEDKEIENLELDDQAKEDDLLFPSNKTPQRCSSNSDCQNSLIGNYSTCNTDSATCECFDTEGSGKGAIYSEGKCYLVKTIGEVCQEHDECDAVISGGAWCHTDLERDTKYCTCQAFYAWDEELKECLPYATQGLESPCKRDFQCSAHEALGPHAMCSEVTGFCECSNPLASETKNIFFYETRCVEEKNFNEDCSIDQECIASLGKDSFCHPETQTCVCAAGGICYKMRRFSFDQPEVSGFTLVVLGLLGVAVMMAGVFCIVSFLRKDESYSYVRQQNDA